MSGAAAAGPADYRPDIDGLRALAVAAVVIFHAGLTFVPGGFVGVDIFFVISGYLIGGHIFGEVREGQFTFANFYARRLRRILPALFAMLWLFYAFALLTLTPLELQELGKEGVPTVFGLSNFLFYTGGGYFGPAADRNPLLMTWSLGVEEQFYVVFPFIMLGLARLKARKEVWALAILSVLSLAASLWMMRHNPTGAFYLLPPRAWELGIGAGLAVWEKRGGGAAGLNGAAAEIASGAGVLLLAAALFLYDPSIAFPGWFALLPTIGTALVIAARRGAANRWLLSAPPVVFTGRVSYSWYLWHWPLFYLNRTFDLPVDPVWLIPVSYVAAVLSWRFVETPFRRRVLATHRVVLVYPVIAALTALPALAFYAGGGLSMRLSPVGRAQAQEAAQARSNACLAPYGANLPRLTADCVPPIAAGQTGRLMLVGDSHASALAPGLEAVAHRAGLAFGEMTKSSCLPLLGYARALPEHAGHWAQCLTYQQAAFAYIAAHPEIRVVALAGYWPTGMTVLGDRGEAPLADALARTIARLHAMDRAVVLVQDVPGFGFDPYARVVGSSLPVRRWLSGVPATEMRARTVNPDPARPVLVAIAAQDPSLRLVDPHASLCDAGGCAYRDGPALFYFDVQHVTPSGAAAALHGFSLGPSGTGGQ